MLVGKLTVTVDSATDITDPSLEGRGNSFCALQVGNRVFSTAVVEGGSSSPVFRSEFELEIDRPANDLAINVYSRDSNRDDQLIGYTTLELKQVFSHGHSVPLTPFPLLVSPEKSGGYINISLTFEQDIFHAVLGVHGGEELRTRQHLLSIREPYSWEEGEFFDGRVYNDVAGDEGQFLELPLPMVHQLEQLEVGMAHELILEPPIEEVREPPIEEVREPPIEEVREPPIEEVREHPIREPDGPAEDLWKTYIQCGEFEYCNVHGIHGDDEIDMGRGRLTAALFPGAFCRHLAALILASKASGAQDLPQFFKNASNFVLGDLPYAKNLQTGAFQFFDEACDGEPVNVDVIFRLGGLIAIFQQFLPDSATNIEYCIVRHDLTGVYLCRRVEKSAFKEDLVMKKAIGVLGLETTSDDILVENVRHDGSYYSGKLEDFSYKFVPNENGDVGQSVDNQCANRLFGHLKGAEFLAGKENGLKCSPLLAIALAIAINRKNLALKWDMTSGHMDIKNSSLMEFENAKWQILYMDNINQLGFAVEWGMQQLMGSGASSSSPAQSKTSHFHTEENLEVLASVVTSGSTLKKTLGGSITLPGGVGIGISGEKRDSKGKDLINAGYKRIMEHFDRGYGRFVETKNLDPKHASVIQCLVQGTLSELPNNYLVVGDNVRHGHVSVYWTDDEHGECAFITDIMLPDAKSTLFQGGSLKGLRMEVERDCSKFVSIDVSKLTSDLISRFKRLIHKKLDIVGGNMKHVPLRSKSKDEWVNLIGPHAIFSGNKYLWEATYMMAIISSRTKYSSGALLEMNVIKDELIGGIGSCARDETDPMLVHKCENVVAWGRFSKAPAYLGANLIKWGGLIRDEVLC